MIGRRLTQGEANLVGEFANLAGEEEKFFDYDQATP
jgi:hypothetical protein